LKAPSGAFFFVEPGSEAVSGTVAAHRVDCNGPFAGFIDAHALADCSRNAPSASRRGWGVLGWDASGRTRAPFQRLPHRCPAAPMPASQI